MIHIYSYCEKGGLPKDPPLTIQDLNHTYIYILEWLQHKLAKLDYWIEMIAIIEFKDVIRGLKWVQIDMNVVRME